MLTALFLYKRVLAFMSLTPGIVGNLILQNQVGLAKSCLEFSLFGINIQRILDACLLLFLLLFLRGEASEEHGHLVHGHPLTCDEITKLVLVNMCWHLLLWSYLASCWQVMILWPPSDLKHFWVRYPLSALLLSPWWLWNSWDPSSHHTGVHRVPLYEATLGPSRKILPSIIAKLPMIVHLLETASLKGLQILQGTLEGKA